MSYVVASFGWLLFGLASLAYIGSREHPIPDRGEVMPEYCMKERNYGRY